MKDTTNQQIRSSHKIGLFNKLNITDQGIWDKNVNIPYSSIKECSCYRNQHGVNDRCTIKYVDPAGSLKSVQYGGRALEMQRDILYSAKELGFDIKQQLHGDLLSLAKWVRSGGVDVTFVYPDSSENVQSNKSWRRNLGGLVFNNSNIASVNVVEQAEITKKRRRGITGKDISTYLALGKWIYYQYSISCKGAIESIVPISCTGSPVKRYTERIVGYQWQSTLDQDVLAPVLNEDTRLCKLLAKVKASGVEIIQSNISMYVSKPPTITVIECLNRIIEDIRRINPP